MKKRLVLAASLSVVLLLSACGAGAERAESYPQVSEHIQTVSGKFYFAAEMEDLEGSREMLYQFRSDDDAVWWLLSEEELGFVPQLLEQQYLLTFDNHGTTPENKGCDCPPEYECECEVYDDEFISISPVVTIEPVLQMY